MFLRLIIVEEVFVKNLWHVVVDDFHKSLIEQVSFPIIIGD